MKKLFDRKRFLEEAGYTEYVNLFIITALSGVIYLSYGIVFLLSAYSHFLIITQSLSLLVCIAAFLINQRKSPRVASILMIFLVCASVNIWAYSVDVGGGMRWWAVLTLFPLYFFSSFKRNDKFLLTALVLFSFLTSLFLTHFREPLRTMPNAHTFDIISNSVIFLSIAGELILYQLLDTQNKNELKRIGTILDNIECGIAIIDAQKHEILDINGVALRMYGDDKESLIGKKCHAFICPAEEGACPVTDNNQMIERSERVLVTADGETLPIVKSVAKIWYEGRPALLESFTDISDLKKAEENLRLLKITERANIAKSEFLSRMSHEMRTPMNAIIGMAQIAGKTDDVNRLKYCLSTINVSSTHLLGIINDILDMSKIEAGKLELASAPLYIENVLMKVCKLMADLIDQKKQKLSIIMTKDTVKQYIGDELRLSQVIANLMSNAVKFTPDGGTIKLTVEATQNDSDISNIRFTIADTGIGMTQGQISRLFNAFEQADGSITRQFGGTGLGLAISKSIVESAGGKIWVESEPDKGSTFCFEIGFMRSAQAGNDTAFEENAICDKKLLVVDMDAETREYVQSIAGWYGIRADVAGTIKEMSECIARAEEMDTPYDLVLLAYNWGDTNGIEIVEEMKAAVDRTSVVIMANVNTWSEIENVAYAAGISRFITKPLFPSSVLKAVKKLTEESYIMPDSKAAAMPDLSGFTVLLAEDVAINREIFIALLEDTKLTIEIAENGVEAVQKFKNHPERYAVIVMDIQMPLMNGYEATRQIRALDVDRAKSIPIVAMSADAFKEDIDKCIASGMNDHLKKPIEIELVVEKLVHYCRNG